jgi:hypothetical protein
LQPQRGRESGWSEKPSWIGWDGVREGCCRRVELVVEDCQCRGYMRER